MLCETILNGRKIWCFDSPLFTYQGKEYQIVGTEITGRGAYDCIHRIRCGTSVKEVPMERLVKMLLAETK
jgi:hypothetical protein